MSSNEPTKNIRLAHQAWHELRNIKFDENLRNYSQVFNLLLEGLEAPPDISEQMALKGESKAPKKGPKTIVVTLEIHQRLADYKIKYLRATDATSRGVGSVSISDVVIALMKNFKSKI
ncbi:MAG: hypothetical protein ACW99A_06410 [Candidatus Kariarchaeaceae archaeon]|jgi:hypothetical protein